MRTNKLNYITSFNEKKANKNTSNVSKSPVRKVKQTNSFYNQYAAMEQAKRDFHKLEKFNYISNQKNFESNMSKENLHSKNSDLTNSREKDKDHEYENRPLTTNYNNYLKTHSDKGEKEKENIIYHKKSSSKSGPYEIVPENISNSNSKLQNSDNYQKNSKFKGIIYTNNFEKKGKEKQIDKDLVNNMQMYTGKNSQVNLNYEININKTTTNQMNQKNPIKYHNYLKDNTNKNHDNSPKNLNYRPNNYKSEENKIASKVNVNLSNQQNQSNKNNFDNIYHFKDSTLQKEPEIETSNKNLNSKIKSLVDKMKEKRINENDYLNMNKKSNLKIKNKNDNDENYYNYPLQIPSSTRSKEISNVIADLQTKNEVLSNQLSSIRDKFIDTEHTKHENSKENRKKNRTNSRASNKSITMAPQGHEKKKSIERISSTNFSKPTNIPKANEKSKNSTINQELNLNLDYLKDKANFNTDFIKYDKNFQSSSNLYIINGNKNKLNDSFKKMNKTHGENNIPEEFEYLNAPMTPTRSPTPVLGGKNYYKFKHSSNSINDEKKEVNLKINNNNNIFNLNVNEKSPLKKFHEKINLKEKEIMELENKLKQMDFSKNISEKNLKKSEQKIESLQNIISDILLKSKNDQIMIENLKNDLNIINLKNSTKEKNYNNTIGENTEDLKKEHKIIHKIYTNFKDYEDGNIKKSETDSIYYFVLISDSNEKHFQWFDISKIYVDSNIGKKSNKSLNYSNDSKIIFETIEFFEKLTRDLKNNNENSSISSKRTIEKNKGETYRNFTALKLPFLNLHSIEKEIVQVYTDYMNFEREFNTSKNYFVEEIKHRDELIKDLKLNLEKLLGDNSNLLKNIDRLKSEIDEKDKKIESQNNIIKLFNSTKNSISNSNNIISELEKKINSKDNEINSLKRNIVSMTSEKENCDKELKKAMEELNISRNIIYEKEDLIEKFHQKLDELELKYKMNFSKLENFESNESLKISSINEEKKKMIGKIQELELMKNSLNDKISILEYINKNFENEKNEKEKMFDEACQKLNEINAKIAQFEQESMNKKGVIIEKDKKIKELEKKIEEKNKEIQSLKEIYGNYEKSINENVDAMSILKEHLKLSENSRKISEEEIDNLQRSLSECQTKLDFKIQENEKNSNELNELKTIINKMKQEKSALIEKSKIAENKANENILKLKNSLIEKANIEQNLNNFFMKTDQENTEIQGLIQNFSEIITKSNMIKASLTEENQNIKDLTCVLLLQEDLITKIELENKNIKKENEMQKKILNENSKDSTLTKERLNIRLLEIQDINIKLDIQLKEKNSIIDKLVKENGDMQRLIEKQKENMDKHHKIISEKSKIISTDEFTIRDLNHKLKNLEIDCKSLENENLFLKNKCDGLEKIISNSTRQTNDNKEKEKIKSLTEENAKLKEELEHFKRIYDRLVDEYNENNILKIAPLNNTVRDEINVTLANQMNTSMNQSSILDLHEHKENKENKEIDEEIKLKLVDYEDKLEKLIISNSELQRRNHALNLEIKTLKDKIFALENFDENEMKKLRGNNGNYKEISLLKKENETLKELNKDYEMSISDMQNKLEMHNNEINNIKEEYEIELNRLKRKLKDGNFDENIHFRLKLESPDFNLSQNKLNQEDRNTNFEKEFCEEKSDFLSNFHNNSVNSDYKDYRYNTASEFKRGGQQSLKDLHDLVGNDEDFKLKNKRIQSKENRKLMDALEELPAEDDFKIDAD